MKKSDFFYELPEALIAQTPMEPRDAARLMIYDRSKKEVEHLHFYDILEELKSGDALVINETKVIPARLFGQKEEGTAKVEILLLKRISNMDWEALLRPGKRFSTGAKIIIGDDLSAEVLEKKEDGIVVLRFFFEGVFETLLDRYGKPPLPPYIHDETPDKERYQTVYAKEDGSAAAPTAGFHFTQALLGKIREKGVVIVPILLHVGIGTFRPVKEENILEHVMHKEYYEVSQQAADTLNSIKKKGGRIIAVGTTSVRTLESVADKTGIMHAAKEETDIFIYPGYQFRAVDAIITNFHLPESTLLMLVSAFIGKEETLRLYDLAVREKYRFFSYGDAMFLK